MLEYPDLGWNIGSTLVLLEDDRNTRPVSDYLFCTIYSLSLERSRVILHFLTLIPLVLYSYLLPPSSPSEMRYSYGALSSSEGVLRLGL